MSDAILPPDDELVSAHLDGEATPAESARVLGDPAWAARATELTAIRDLVAAPVAPPTEVREGAIGAALDLFDELRANPRGELTSNVIPGRGDEAAGPGAGPGAGPAVQDDELAVRRAAASAKARRASRNGKILAVAAVFVVVLAGLGAVVRSSLRSKTETTATAAAPTSTSRDAGSEARSSESANDQSANDQSAKSSTANDGAQPAVPTTRPATGPATTASGGAASTTTAPTAAPNAANPVPDIEAFAQDYRFQSESLGTVSTPDQLRARVITAIAGDAAAPSSTVPSPDAQGADVQALAAVSTCDEVIRGADREVGPIVFSAPVLYNGTSAVVLVYSIDRAAHPAANGASRLYAVDASSCAVLDVQTG